MVFSRSLFLTVASFVPKGDAANVSFLEERQQLRDTAPMSIATSLVIYSRSYLSRFVGLALACTVAVPALWGQATGPTYDRIRVSFPREIEGRRVSGKALIELYLTVTSGSQVIAQNVFTELPARTTVTTLPAYRTTLMLSEIRVSGRNWSVEPIGLAVAHPRGLGGLSFLTARCGRFQFVVPSRPYHWSINANGIGGISAEDSVLAVSGKQVPLCFAFAAPEGALNEKLRLQIGGQEITIN